MNDPMMRLKVEDFLYAEAALLDEWRVDEWFALFAEGSTYEVPPMGAEANADSSTALFYIADDYTRLRERVVRLNSKEAHSEYPRSRLRHVVSNVRVLGTTDGIAEVACNFITYRARRGVVDAYFGRHEYRIDVSGDSWKIRSKRTTLDMDMLYPGKLSVIV